MYVSTLRRSVPLPRPATALTPVQFHRADHFVHREIAGEHLLIALRREAVAPIFSMTPTAAAIWDRLDGWLTVAELTEHVVAEFDVEHSRAEQDVREFLSQLDAAHALLAREG
jgi:hypothetical protein